LLRYNKFYCYRRYRCVCVCVCCYKPVRVPITLAYYRLVLYAKLNSGLHNDGTDGTVKMANLSVPSVSDTGQSVPSVCDGTLCL